jgi:AcrR family transcriptional regulator
MSGQATGHAMSAAGAISTRELPARRAYRVASGRILDAATAVFAAQGYDRASMAAIAERAGVTKPTLYARFGSKEELFEAALKREYEVRTARLFAAFSGVNREAFRDRLHRLTSTYFQLIRDRPEGVLLIAEGERHPRAAALIRQANSEIVQRTGELVVQISGRRPGPGTHLVAVMISGIFTACAREAVLSEGMDVDRASAVCESFLDGALRGLEPRLLDAADK